MLFVARSMLFNREQIKFQNENVLVFTRGGYEFYQLTISNL